MDTNHAHNKSCSKTGEIRRKEDEGNNVLSAPATDKNPKKRDDRKVGISNKMKKKGEKVCIVCGEIASSTKFPQGCWCRVRQAGDSRVCCHESTEASKCARCTAEHGG
jgi:hypothetical protein